MNDNRETGRKEPLADDGSRSGQTASLIARAKEGDQLARNGLFERHIGVLQRWAHGRLPARARGPMETQDLVQETLLRALARIDEFEPRRDGAFLAYLRTILMNRVREEARRSGRRPGGEELPEDLADPGPSPIEEAIGRETLMSYERALSRLGSQQRAAIVLRQEMGLSYREVAEELGIPSENAARMKVVRALERMAELMGEAEV